MMKDTRLRRSRLYVPGNNPAMIQNAGVFRPDSIIFDLEDSVALNEKDAARDLVRYALLELEFCGAEKTVRINPPGTPFFKDDLQAIVPARPDALVLPKTESAESVRFVAAKVAALEKQYNIPVGTIKLMPIIETARGVLNVEEIAAADRVVAISPGGEDLTADLGVERTLEGDELYYIRQKLSLAAHAHGIQVLDTVYSRIGDREGLIKATRKIIQMGFHGKACIHPCQIEPIHEAFLPPESEVYRAKYIVEEYERALARGQGAIAIDGKMIDVPVYERMKTLLRRARAGGMKI